MVCNYVLSFLLDTKIENRYNKGCSMLVNRRPPVWELAVHLVGAADVFDGVLFCVVLFPTRYLGMRSKIELSHFLRIFLPTCECTFIAVILSA